MKQHTLPSALFAVALLFSLAACKKDPVEPVPGTTPPLQQPNPLPENALLKQIKWAENDFFTITYNDQKQVLQLHSQWEFVQGDPTQIRSVDYDFQYDAQQRLSQVNQTGGGVSKYIYDGNLIKKVQDFYPSGVLANETAYEYANNRISQEIYSALNPLGEPPTVYKRVFDYDTKGNLNKVETYQQQADQTYKLLQINTYSDFDNKINPRSWLLRYPYLPQVRWQFNNPGKEVIKIGEDTPKTILYTNTYNQQGLPVSNVQNGHGGVLRAVYQY